MGCHNGLGARDVLRCRGFRHDSQYRVHSLRPDSAAFRLVRLKALPLSPPSAPRPPPPTLGDDLLCFSLIACPQTRRGGVRRLALDIVTLETYTELTLSRDRPSWMHDPLNPFMVAANVAWLVFFGA